MHMAETIYEKDGKIPVVSRTYTITDEYIEYESVNRSFKINYEDITVFDSTPLGKNYKIYIEGVGRKQEAKLEPEAHSALLGQLQEADIDVL